MESRSDFGYRLNIIMPIFNDQVSLSLFLTEFADYLTRTYYKVKQLFDSKGFVDFSFRLISLYFVDIQTFEFDQYKTNRGLNIALKAVTDHV